MKPRTKQKAVSLLLAICILLSCAACGGKAAAAAMHLRKTEGTVGVLDDGGKDLEPRENLGLYSGYGVDTRAESYAWIDLDDVKLTKLDENSQIEIQKDGKKLEIDVKSGSLFFNVTEPLADDETMEIRTSSMLVGIRGTCGWVTQDTAALLEGTVTIIAGEQAVTVNAGEMAILSREGELQVRPFMDQEIPAFVREETRELPPEETPEGPQDTGSPADILAERDKHGPSRITYYSGDGTPFSLSENTLDEEGRVLHTVISGLSEFANSTSYADYIYDDQGRWLETRHYDGAGNLTDHTTLLESTVEREELAHTSITSTYDAGGNIVGTQTNTGRIVELYDGDGRYIRSEYYNQDGTLDDYALFEYDERGRIIQQNVYLADGTLMEYGVYEYED